MRGKPKLLLASQIAPVASWPRGHTGCLQRYVSVWSSWMAWNVWIRVCASLPFSRELEPAGGAVVSSVGYSRSRIGLHSLFPSRATDLYFRLVSYVLVCFPFNIFFLSSSLALRGTCSFSLALTKGRSRYLCRQTLKFMLLSQFITTTHLSGNWQHVTGIPHTFFL